jgi:hypothetical protein
MSPEEIEVGRRHDAQVKERFFETGKIPVGPEATAGPAGVGDRQARTSFWQKFKKWLFG